MGRITLNEAGFDLTSDSGEQIASVEWLEIDRIEAYNIDLICLDFFSGEETATVNEDDAGFEDLAPQLIANLDLEDPDWFQRAMRPATSAERILVFDRDEGY